MNLVSVSYRFIGTWYRFDMGDFGDIGLNILLTDTDILVPVSVYRYRSNSSPCPERHPPTLLGITALFILKLLVHFMSAIWQGVIQYRTYNCSVVYRGWREASVRAWSNIIRCGCKYHSIANTQEERRTSGSHRPLAPARIFLIPREDCCIFIVPGGGSKVFPGPDGVGGFVPCSSLISKLLL